MRQPLTAIPINIPGLAIYECNGGDPAHRKMLLEMYPQWFPQYAYYLRYMEYRTSQPVDYDPRFVERWWYVERDSKPAGFRFSKYLKARGISVGMGSAIVKEYREFESGGYHRLSEVLFNLTIEQLLADAEACGQPTPDGFVVEIESPRLVNGYKRYGYNILELPIDYLEPPFMYEYTRFIEPEMLAKLKFEPMHLVIFPVPGKVLDPNDKHLLTNIALGLLVDHYGLSEDHWAVQRALASIDLVGNRPKSQK